jgi:hypothetical protein
MQYFARQPIAGIAVPPAEYVVATDRIRWRDPTHRGFLVTQVREAAARTDRRPRPTVAIGIIDYDRRALPWAPDSR